MMTHITVYSLAIRCSTDILCKIKSYKHTFAALVNTEYVEKETCFHILFII